MSDSTTSSINSKLLATFHEDSQSICENVYALFLQLQKQPDQMELIHRSFREVHSLKSEADYLQYNTIARQAHKLESLLADLRERETGIDAEILDTLFAALDILQGEIEQTLKRRTASQEEGEQREHGVKSFEHYFGEFEKKLLGEAHDRGETFYRVICEIEEDAPMKFPRLYLLINNLEQLVNVIKLVPPVDQLKEHDNELTIFFTASIDEEHIYDALNVDEVREVQLSTLDFTSFNVQRIRDESLPEAPYEDHSLPYIRIESEKIDDLLGHVNELQFRVVNMEKQALGEDQVRSLKSIAEHLERILRSIRMVPLGNEFERLSRFTREMAERVGKKVELFTNGHDLEIDRGVLEILSEILLHMVRNAIDHGIESPEQRRERGKSETGSIMVSGMKTGHNLIIQILDDGQGISEERIREKAGELGLDLEQNESQELISILSMPRFSTKDVVTDSSGRGVGLDLVSKKLGLVAGSSFRLVTRVGKGTMFTIELPGSYSLVRFVLTTVGEHTVAIPKRSIVDTFPIEKDAMQKDEHGRLFYKGTPIYGLGGKVSMQEGLPSGAYAVLLSHLEHTGCLLVDEILFEKELPESGLKLEEELFPGIYSITIAGHKQDYLYLNPAIIAR